MAKKKPTAPVAYYARIPAQNPRGNPPHVAGNISIFGFRFTADGPWVGPFNAAKAETLREHAVTDKAAMTFEVVEASECQGQPGGPPAPERPARKRKGTTDGNAADDSEDEGPENPQAGEGAAFGRTRRAKPSDEKKTAKRKPARKSRARSRK